MSEETTLSGSEGHSAGTALPSSSTLPQVPPNATEQVRQQLAARGRRDLFFLCKGILGYNRLTRRTHLAMCRFMTTCKMRRRMLQMPRSHFKSTICTIAHPIQLILNDPEIRILLVASSSANAERFLEEIKNHFQANTLLRWLYPDVIPEDFSKVRWSRQEMEVARTKYWREPTIDTIGSRGTVASRHYNMIKADDIIGEKEYYSPAEMEKTIEWFSGVESLLISPEEDAIDVIGTRWRMDDVYSFAEDFYGGSEEPRDIGPHAYKRGEIAVFRRAFLENGKPIFPEMFSLEFYQRMLRENPERTAAQYANDPRSAGVSTFQEDWLRYYRIDPEKRFVTFQPTPGAPEERIPVSSLERGILCDPAVAESKRAARNAIHVVGQAVTGDYPYVFVLESVIAHIKPNELIDELYRLQREWNVDWVSIEKYGFQGTLKYWLRERAMTEGWPYMNVREFPPKGHRIAKQAKDERIEALQPLFRAGYIWFHQTQSELIEEYLYYPRGKFRDGMDALAQGPIWWGHTPDQQYMELMREEEEKILASIGPTGYDLRARVYRGRRERERDSFVRTAVGGLH